MDTGLIEPSGNEWRLMHAVVLNAMVLYCTYRFVRHRTASDALAAVPQAILGWFAVQYVSVALPGLVGMLNRWSITGVGLGIAGVLYLLSQRRTLWRDAEASGGASGLDQHVVGICILFLLGYIAAIIGNQRLIPVMSDDALTYHLPAAVRWLQTGRLVLHETWFFNPANTYSPLAGSTFAAWWLAPLGNDYVARFMQVPGLVLIFFGMLQLGRELGAPLRVAAPLALASVLARPFVSQAIVAKDDLFLSGFFISAVLACSPRLLRDPLGAWRLGIALGLFLATKITAVLALPLLLLLLIDAPMRSGWRWRQWVLMVVCAVTLAGPWFARNLYLTGNPLYPVELSIGEQVIWPGLFRVERSLELRTPGGLWQMVTGSYFSIPRVVFGPLGLTWLIALISAGRAILSKPLVRACLIGPPVGVVVFALAAPFPEVRFLNPTFLLLFGSFAVLANRVAGVYRMDTLGVWGLVVLCAASAFIPEKARPFALVGVAAAGVAPLVVYVARRWPMLAGRLLGFSAGLGGLVLAMGAYVYQDALIAEYAQATPIAWQMEYKEIADAWFFVREQVPAEKVVAYTNTYYVYPLFGFEGRRDVVYAPVRRGVALLHDLPGLGQSIPGEKLRERITQAINSNPDRAAWLENLERKGAAYLLIAKGLEEGWPPERDWVGEDPGRFAPVFQNEAAVVYEIRWPGQ